jgi:lipopolysaccharide/colanic/teichoic acid biosynthesis glycosyltransferase
MARSAAATAWPRRYRRALITVDTAVVLAALGTCAVLPVGAVPLPMLAVLALVWPVALGAYGSREPAVFGAGAEEYRRVVTSSVHVAALAVLGGGLSGAEGLVPLMAALLSAGVVGLVAGRWALRRWLARERRDGLCLTPAIVAGERQDVEDLVRRLAAGPDTPYNILGVALPDGHRGDSLAVDAETLPVLCSLDEVVRTAALKRASAVVVAGPVRGRPDFVRSLGWRLGEHDAELVLATPLTEPAGPRIHWHPIEGLPLIGARLPRPTAGMRAAKRAVDLVLSALGLAVLAPLVAVLALAAKVESPGPVLLRRSCAGRGGRPFMLLTLRPAVRWRGWTTAHALEACPQLVNVLLGHMSLVGPPSRSPGGVPGRPGWALRPGITGRWAPGTAPRTQADGWRADLDYIEGWSLTEDCVLLLRALAAAVRGRGAPGAPTAGER